MDNEKKGLYERIDGAIMNGVNAGVRAWNWSTGRTRADLANLVYCAAGVTFLAGGIIKSNFFDALMAGACLVTGGERMDNNQELDYREMKALEKGLVDLSIEERKESCRMFGGAAFFGGSIPIVFDVSNSTSVTLKEYAEFTSGMCEIGVSEYIMRADYLPPRKDCVRRGVEKLTKKLKEIKIPLPEPLPVPSMSYQVI